jgi:hypothetical protein
LCTVSASRAALPEKKTMISWNTAVAAKPMSDHLTAQMPRCVASRTGSIYTVVIMVAVRITMEVRMVHIAHKKIIPFRKARRYSYGTLDS